MEAGRTTTHLSDVALHLGYLACVECDFIRKLRLKETEAVAHFNELQRMLRLRRGSVELRT